MTDSRYVMLTGQDAAQFATEQHIQQQSLDWFVTPYRQHQLVAAQSSDAIILDHEPAEDPNKGTVGAVALDVFGNLYATSTGACVTNALDGLAMRALLEPEHLLETRPARCLALDMANNSFNTMLRGVYLPCWSLDRCL